MTSRSTRSTGALRERGERGAPARRGLHLVALAPEPAGEHVAVVLAVVHDQDHRPRRRRRARRRSRVGGRPRGRRGGPRGPGPAARRAARWRRRMRSRSASRAAAPAAAARRCRLSPAARTRSSGGPSVPRAAARSGGPVWPARQHLVQQGQELAGVGAEGGEVRGQLGLVAGLQLLEQHLGVADDVVQRRAQLVAELGAGLDAHGRPLTRRTPARAAPRSSRAAGRARRAWCRSRRSPPPAPSPGRRPWRARSAR